MEIKALADSNGKIVIHVKEGNTSQSIDLDFLLQTELYRASCPSTEENRLKGMKPIFYEFKNES